MSLHMATSSVIDLALLLYPKPLKKPELILFQLGLEESGIKHGFPNKMISYLTFWQLWESGSLGSKKDQIDLEIS